nr:MAG TPA: hypothetical protein [Caudoviricetes sp.]
MTQKYTPSEGEVRRAYASYMTLNGVHAGSVVVHHFLSEGKVIEFNSWLAAHDARIRADAWDEGFTEGRDLAVSGQPMTRNNPYREQKQ